MYKPLILMSLGFLAILPNCTQLIPTQSLPETSMNTNIAATSSIAELEKAVNQQINQYRASKKLPPLSVDPRISQIARIHSENMASGKVKFSHDGFEGRAKAITVPYQSVAENVAYNFGYSDPVGNAVEGWIKSEGHRKNIESQFNLTGIAIAKNAKGEYYFTQLFVRSR
ncbi:MAG: CAP domain-containing protein [Microcoleus sp. PH2017_10_PVI_O_A]|nr:CAP domain-containing protein [Microcoleus sp. PH2017_10_PVI_O_A]MCC3463467.1 CAP domain-containing protein [Microcoleus sp. PH2017_11_PCY_U_A]MCC3481819.1 CAP domain-containing protein [Microcoleus sp. PH2017_12_PCY_D_A]MCC3531576.1 CAP domain-containing protein [Microcoleus sp. PH2017_21_RUC_O_A]MCC3543888.1 CAP domain-containing protein [Microcoleus sp. PH2017_22_RUC_O_B]MCC3563407.1 CAP domain-containing protein [Microcoleus sp. PH2017_27_LUM_O_A]TAE74115.1 MAG: CAP domain-containing p